MVLKGAKNDHNLFKSNLNEIKIGKLKSKEQIIAMENIEMLYNVRNKVIKLFDYFCLRLNIK